MKTHLSPRIFMLLITACLIAGAAMADDAGTVSGKNATFESAAKIDPELAKLLKINDLQQIRFMEKLTPEEQRKLATVFKKRLETESDGLLRVMATTSSFLPAILLGKLAPMVGAETASKLTSHISVKRAVKIAKHTNRNFLAECALYTDPAKTVAVNESMPDALALDVMRRVLAKGRVDVVGRFSDYTSPERLKNLAMAINDPEILLEIARNMNDKERLMTAVAMMPDDFLLKMLRQIDKDKAFEMAAALARQMDPGRQIQLMEKLEPAEAARIAVHYPPETIAALMEKTNEAHAIEIARNMPGPIVGQVSNLLTAETINRFWPHIEEEKIRSSLPEINLLRIQRIWPNLSPEVKDALTRMAGEYKPLENILQAMQTHETSNH